MATLVKPTNLQKMEFNVTTAEGPSRVTIVTGTMEITVGVNTAAVTSPSNDSTAAQHTASIKALLDPVLAPGQFRRATAIASLNGMNYAMAVVPPSALVLAPGVTATGRTSSRWIINDAQATFDDETGQVQLVIDVFVEGIGTNVSVFATSLMFQVTTLAMA